MSRQLTAVLVSTALVFGNASNAWFAPDRPDTIRSQISQKNGSPTNNPPPLAPGRAAGIKEAQAYESYALDALLAITALAVVVILLVNNNDDFTSSTGTE